MKTDFSSFFSANYKPIQGISLGRPFFDGHIYTDDAVNIPLNILTRHGLITGSTGTGKSRAIQLLIEGLVKQGIPVFLSDIKGDMSGFSRPADATKVAERSGKLKYNFEPQAFPTNYWGSAPGLINFRVNLAHLDYVVLAKLLELNPTQESHLVAMYKYARDNKIEITDLKSLNELIAYLIKYPEKSVGTSAESLKVISRKILNLEYSNADKFFGTPELDVADLLGSPRVNVLWLQNYQQEKFNVGNIITCLLYKLYMQLPEVGGVDKPKLMIFIDEAHQIFKNANPSLINLVVAILKQIRSKGVGIIFNTQSADDIPQEIQEQLGLKVQFALRSFSGKELQEIRGIMESFPRTDYYDLREEIKSLETGTAFVSTLNDRGALLPPVKTMIFPPASFMDALAPAELTAASDTVLVERYAAKTGSEGLQLGSPLDNVTVSRGGKWQMKTFLDRKEEQAVRRAVNKKNRDFRKTLVMIIVILGIVALIFFMVLVLSMLNQQK